MSETNLGPRARRKGLKGGYSVDPAQVIAITSGKGGVGKTNIVANLGYSLCRLQRRVMILDGDLGLANLDMLLGLTPTYTIQHVLQGEKNLEETIIEGPGGVKILPASSGIPELAEVTPEQKLLLLTQLESLVDQIDVLLIDTAGGISSTVMFFNTMADQVVMVVSPEPTSIATSYAMMEVLSSRYAQRRFQILVNFVRSESEGLDVYRRLNVVTENSPSISISYLGWVPVDEYLQEAVKRQRAVAEIFPTSKASKNFVALAQKITQIKIFSTPGGGPNLFRRPLTQEPTNLPKEGALPQFRETIHGN
jgi:flagellar biosynthesis protein FlhG